jgi:hypothetical protein
VPNPGNVKRHIRRSPFQNALIISFSVLPVSEYSLKQLLHDNALTEAILASRCPIALISLWDMLRSYFPIYEVARHLEALWHDAEFFKDSASKEVLAVDANDFRKLPQ